MGGFDIVERIDDALEDGIVFRCDPPEIRLELMSFLLRGVSVGNPAVELENEPDERREDRDGVERCDFCGSHRCAPPQRRREDVEDEERAHATEGGHPGLEFPEQRQASTVAEYVAVVARIDPHPVQLFREEAFGSSFRGPFYFSMLL